MVPYHTMIYGPCRMMVDNPMQEDRLVVPASVTPQTKTTEYI